MSAQAFQGNKRRRLDDRAHCVHTFECNTKASHTGVDFEMHGLWGRSEMFRRTIQRRDLLRLPNSCREIATNNLLLFAPPEAGHEQDSSADTRFPKGNSFVGRCHSQPLRASRFECKSALGSSVTVGIRFYNTANLNVRTDERLQGLKVAAQGLQRYFCPGGTSELSDSWLCDRDHYAAIIAAGEFAHWLRE